jgi:excisionase family DNA binding protein
MTVAQAAKHAGVSRQRITEFVNQGRLPIVRIDKLTQGARTHNKYLIRKSTLDSFLATGVKPVGRPVANVQPEPDSPVED